LARWFNDRATNVCCLKPQKYPFTVELKLGYSCDQRNSSLIAKLRLQDKERLMVKNIQAAAAPVRATARRVYFLLAIIIVAAMLSNVLLPSAQAASGDLDATFGIGGKAVADFSGAASQARALAIQSDGKIIAAGVGNTDFAIARFNSNGTLDASFGAGGKVTTDFFGGNDTASAIGIQSDGKILAGGTARNSALNLDFALARYNSNGSLDGDFGSGGKTFADFFNRNDEANGLAIQANGKIVLAGTAASSDEFFVFGLARFASDGSIDNSFGVGGKTTTSFFGSNNFAQAVAIQSAGKIIAAGSANINVDSFVMALARYEGDGPAFDICLQDDRNGNLLQFNSTTGDYQFFNCRKGFSFAGRGEAQTRFCKTEFRASGPDRVISASVNVCTRAGSASIRVLPQPATYSISDSDITNNSCACR
jgi:uncharacterized delta-60 repeat protein